MRGDYRGARPHLDRWSGPCTVLWALLFVAVTAAYSASGPALQVSPSPTVAGIRVTKVATGLREETPTGTR